jgi:hypothetical protein
VRLNVGCGEFRAEGWLNIDVVQNEHVASDLVASVTDLPAHVTGLTAVYCGHVLEHIPHDAVVPALRVLRERMVPGARIMCVGPDVHRAEAMFRAGEIDETTCRSCHAETRPPRWAGDAHHWDCHEAELVTLLTEAGFVDVHAVAVGGRYLLTEWPLVSGVGWQCAVEGSR